MLRFLGFMTGSALTAALALAIVDPVTLESLRRSAATLFLGVDPAAPVVTQTAQPVPDDAAQLPHAGPSGTSGSVRTRLLAALPGRTPTPTDDVVMRPATPPDASPAATVPLDVAGVPASDAGQWQSAVAGPAPSAADRTAPTGATAAARSRGFDSGTGESIGGLMTGDTGTFDSGALHGGTDRPTVAGEPVPTGDIAGTLAVEPAPSATVDSAGVAAADVSGSDLGALPPPSEADGDGGWHAFWTPFHSEASATGFARHLERATGESYRVVRTGPGAYRVAFWHEGEDERGRRLLAIEQASGLSLRGGTL